MKNTKAKFKNKIHFLSNKELSDLQTQTKIKIIKMRGIVLQRAKSDGQNVYNKGESTIKNLKYKYAVLSNEINKRINKIGTKK